MDFIEFLDSNIVVYAFTNNPRKEKCRKVLRERNLITNTLVIAESIAQIGIITDKEQARQAFIAILKYGNVKIVELDGNLLFESVKRAQKYDLKLFDLIHYTTCILNNCQGILSYDDDFNKLEIPRNEP